MERAFSCEKGRYQRLHGLTLVPPKDYTRCIWVLGCDTGALPPLTSRRSVLVLVTSTCDSADLRVFASAGAAARLSTSQRREHWLTAERLGIKASLNVLSCCVRGVYFPPVTVLSPRHHVFIRYMKPFFRASTGSHLFLKPLRYRLGYAVSSGCHPG